MDLRCAALVVVVRLGPGRRGRCVEDAMADDDGGQSTGEAARGPFVVAEIARLWSRREELVSRYNAIAPTVDALDAAITQHQQAPRPYDERDEAEDRTHRETRNALVRDMTETTESVARIDRDIVEFEHERAMHVEALQAKYEGTARRYLDLDGVITAREQEPRPGDEADAEADRQRRAERDQLSHDMNELRQQFDTWGAKVGPEGTADRMAEERRKADSAESVPPPPAPVEQPPSGNEPPSDPTAEPPVEDVEGVDSPSQIRTVVGLIAAVVILAGGLAAWLNSGGRNSSRTSTAAASEASSSLAGLDGHWVLATGLQNPYYDFGDGCELCVDPSRQTTIDKSSVTMDISDTKITGGTFKTGFSSTVGGDPCTIFESKVDATVSGGVDINQNYGQLIVDGTDVFKDGCDSNLQQRETKRAFHTSRFFFLKGDTLVLCYNIDPSTYAACTTTGLSDPSKAGDGTVGTFNRG